MLEVAIRLVLLAVLIVLETLEPFERVILQEEMWQYQYPFIPNTVPSYAVVLLSCGVPVAFVILCCIFHTDYKDLIHSALGLSLAVVINGVVTNIIKLSVGRPRPDYYWRCYPDGVVPEDLHCTGDTSDIIEGRKSFPSGHSSWIFTGFVYLSLYLAGKLMIFHQSGRGHSLRLLLVLTPLLVATMVAISRVRDYWHHWEDVTVGAFIGTAISILCYLQYHPNPSSSPADITHDNHINELTEVKIL